MDREGKSKDEQRAVWRQNTIDQINWQQEHTKQFHAKYMVMAKYYKDLLLDRLSASQREFLIGKNSQADMNLDSQELAGGFNEYGIAAYLDQLATYACPSQAPSDSKSGH